MHTGTNDLLRAIGSACFNAAQSAHEDDGDLLYAIATLLQFVRQHADDCVCECYTRGVDVGMESVDR